MEPRDGLRYTLDPRDGLRYTLGPRDGLRYTPDPRDGLRYTLDPRYGLRYTLDPRNGLLTTVYPGTRTCQEICKTRNYDVHVIVYICNYSTIHITDAKYEVPYISISWSSLFLDKSSWYVLAPRKIQNYRKLGFNISMDIFI